jgi:predicted nuclease of predicted toxin-antitoxin system
MSLAIVVDMNLSVEWLPLLAAEGWPAVHWSQVGDPRADDVTVMAWARANRHAVFTHDLDFTTALALTHAHGPSLIQIRGQQVLPEQEVGGAVTAAIRRYEAELEQGALVTVDVARARVRILPL